MLSFSVGTSVLLRTHSATHFGTIYGGAMHEGELRYIFHLDERITAFSFPDRYIYGCNLEACDRRTDDQIAAINAHGYQAANGSGSAAA